MSNYTLNQVTEEELRRRHKFSEDQYIIPTGIEKWHISDQSLIPLRLDFSKSALNIRNTFDFFVGDIKHNIPSISIEAKKEMVKTLEITQLLQNIYHCRQGKPVYYSLGKNLLVKAIHFHLTKVTLSPNSEKYVKEDWGIEIKNEGGFMLSRSSVPGDNSHDPFYYIDYDYVKLHSEKRYNL